jgi:hypothetical protein
MFSDKNFGYYWELFKSEENIENFFQGFYNTLTLKKNYKTGKFEMLTETDEEYLTLQEKNAILYQIESRIHALMKWKLINNYVDDFDVVYEIWDIVKHNFNIVVNEVRNLWLLSDLNEGKNISASKFTPIENDEDNPNDLLNNGIRQTYNNYEIMAAQGKEMMDSIYVLEKLYKELRQLINVYGNIK